jgi:hypothetical protein
MNLIYVCYIRVWAKKTRDMMAGVLRNKLNPRYFFLYFCIYLESHSVLDLAARCMRDLKFVGSGQSLAHGLSVCG